MVNFLASTIPLPHMQLNRTWLHRWIYHIAAGFMFAAGALRALIIFQDNPLLGKVILLLAAWLLLFFGNTFLARRLPWSTAVFLILEAVLILILLLGTEQDFFAFLFGILGMQAMQRYSPRVVGGVIVFSAVLTFLSLLGPIGALQAAAGRLHVRGLRVVEVFHTVDLRDPLEPVLDSLETSHSIEQAFCRYAGQQGYCCRGEHVFQVVLPSQADVFAAEEGEFPGFIPPVQLPVPHKSPMLDGVPATEEHRRRIHFGRDGSRAGIVGIQDCGVFWLLILKDARFGAGVGLERVVTVEVIRSGSIMASSGEGSGRSVIFS